MPDLASKYLRGKLRDTKGKRNEIGRWKGTQKSPKSDVQRERDLPVIQNIEASRVEIMLFLWLFFSPFDCLDKTIR